MNITHEKIDQIVRSHPVVFFIRGMAQSPMRGFSGHVVQVPKACGVDRSHTVDVLEDDEIRQGIKDYANWPTIPQLYIKDEFIGSSDIVIEMYQSGELRSLLAA